MRRLLEVALTGLVAIRLHPLRSLVSFVAVVAVLLPYLVGLGLAKGLEAEAQTAARVGADLYVKGTQFGRPVPLPLRAVEKVRKIDGVTAVVPRIIGEVVLGKEQIHAVLVGMPREHFPEWAGAIEGGLPSRVSRLGPHELVLGAPLARRLGLKVGSPILPFYHNDRLGDRNSVVVGIFLPTAPLWQANLVLTTFEDAAAIFDQPGLATDLLVWCRQGYQDAVTRAIVRLVFASPGEREPIQPPALALLRGLLQLVGLQAERGTVWTRVTAREDLLVLLPRGGLHNEGIFTVHFLLAFVVGILVLLVTSGVGLAERRREVGILKATGWQTDEVLLRHLAESFALSLASACTALLLAWAWLRLFNGYGVAGFFLPGIGTSPDFAVPFRLTPIPALLAFVLSFVIVLSGTLYSAWRAATVPPREAMR
ncbi:MAG TPA: FtsX-like permease family protein [Gemmataceae bacterium]|nr:FtsX-like permease family protein [Gemmataceae bacterium]